MCARVASWAFSSRGIVTWTTPPLTVNLNTNSKGALRLEDLVFRNESRFCVGLIMQKLPLHRATVSGIISDFLLSIIISLIQLPNLLFCERGKVSTACQSVWHTISDTCQWDGK